MNIIAEIRKQNHGSLPAVIHGERVISFDELFTLVDEIKKQLVSRHGILDGSGACIPRIGVAFPNGLGYIILAMAVIDAGACFVPIPDELTKCERERLIRDTALHAILTPDEGNSGVGAIKLPLASTNALLINLDTAKPQFPESEFEALMPAFIRFSSGTTAASKGVVISHQSLLERITAANTGLSLKRGEKVLWTLPMAHHFAVSIVLYLYHGAATVLELSHEPDKIYQAARDSGANLLYGSPFHFARLAQCQDAQPLPELRLAVATASALSHAAADAFSQRFDLPLTQALGIIEVGLPIINLNHAHDIPTALGQPLTAYEWKIINPQTGVGELYLKGPGMFDAYLLPWKKREQLSADGWFATGDLVEVIHENTLQMRGRCKSVINVGGMKVFPEEIEAVLNTHPTIHRCRAFAKHHETIGSFPCAEMIIEEGMEPPSQADLKKHCSHQLASYKIPMQFVKVDHISQTASGKVKRH
ncbi:MAG: class I adenylate-forming enzyme family protein [Akkermansiaceae bacterium]